MSKFEKIWQSRPWYLTEPSDKEIAEHWFKQGSEYGEWVSAADYLPPPSYNMPRSSAVLIYCPENKCIFEATYEHADQEWRYFGGNGDVVRFRVTHWLPLPEPPTGDKP